jgi:hypothetical protein
MLNGVATSEALHIPDSAFSLEVARVLLGLLGVQVRLSVHFMHHNHGSILGQGYLRNGPLRYSRFLLGYLRGL